MSYIRDPRLGGLFLRRPVVGRIVAEAEACGIEDALAAVRGGWGGPAAAPPSRRGGDASLGVQPPAPHGGLASAALRGKEPS